MKLALVLHRIAENDAAQWTLNMADLPHKSLSEGVFLVVCSPHEDELIHKLRHGLSGASSVVLYVLNGTLLGIGPFENAGHYIQALFEN